MWVDGWPELLLLLAVTMAGSVAGPLVVLIAGVKLHEALERRRARPTPRPPAPTPPAAGSHRRMPAIWRGGDGPAI